mmetsp:Transcript_14597/g.29382  ORF Transcript_14597/g.29382 Transcript_14597/m.29382 type:complete len:132 (-) Transcript_14597:2059-2454(-)
MELFTPATAHQKGKRKTGNRKKERKMGTAHFPLISRRLLQKKQTRTEYMYGPTDDRGEKERKAGNRRKMRATCRPHGLSVFLSVSQTNTALTSCSSSHEKKEGAKEMKPTDIFSVTFKDPSNKKTNQSKLN